MLWILWQASSSSWLEAQGFTNIGSYGYWSSTTSTNFNPINGVFVDLYSGAVSNTWKEDHGAVLPVRAGQTNGNPDSNYPANIWQTGQKVSYSPNDDGAIEVGVAWPASRFADNGDGTVTDTLSGLIWLKNANCLATNYSGVDADGKVTWQNALDFVAGINSGSYSDCGAGHSDWRLPNRKELYSLIDFSQSNPDLPAGHPFINVAVSTDPYYWSSTTYSNQKSSAWFLYTRHGDISSSPKTSNRHVWPVRGESGQLPVKTNPMPWNPLLLLGD